MGKWQRLTPAVAITALVFVVYSGSLDNSFHFDDDHSILQNDHLQSTVSIPSFFVDATAFSGDPQYGVMYRPLVVTSLALNYAISGLAPWSYHLVNVLLHAGVCVVLWMLLRRFMPGYARQAWLAAALVAVHPIHSQVVNYVSSRSGLLATLGVIVALLCATAARSRVRGGGTALAHLAGLLSKSTAIVLVPLVALRAIGSRQVRLVWAVPLAATIGASAVYLVAATATGFLGQSLGQLVRPVHVQAMTQAKAGAYYLWLTAMPTHLSVIHPFTVAWTLSVSVLASTLLIVSIAAISLRYWLRQGDEGAYGVLWILGSLGVTFFMPLNVIVSEQRLYLGGVGAALFGVALLGRRPVAFGRVWVLAGLCVLGLLTIQRTSVWQSELSLWQSALRWAPDNPRVYASLGAAYYRAGNPQAARVSYQRTVELVPENANAWLNLGVLAERAGEPSMAEENYRRTLALRPDWAQAQRRLGAVLLQGGDLEEAVSLLERALVVKPHAGALVNLGVAHRRLGDVVSARRDFEAALALVPDHVDAIINLGVLSQELALDASGDRRQQGLQEARRYYEWALVLAPLQAQALLNLGGLLRVTGQTEAAISVYKQATEAHPRLASAYAGLGELLVACGQWLPAIAALEDAVELDSSNVKPWGDLARARARAGQLQAASEAFGRVIILDGESAENLYNRAEVLTALGQQDWIAGERKSARRHWYSALEHYRRIDTDFRRTRQRLEQLEQQLR